MFCEIPHPLIVSAALASTKSQGASSHDQIVDAMDLRKSLI